MTSASARIGRVLSIAIASVSIVTLFAWIWLDSWKDVNQQIELSERKIAHLRETISRSNEILRKLQREASSNTAAKGYITAPDTNRATAELQKLVKQSLSQANGTINSAQPLPPRLENAQQIVGTKFQLSIPEASLADFLFTLEFQPIYIFVDLADISVPQNFNNATSRMILSVQLEVHAYWQDNKGA